VIVELSSPSPIGVLLHPTQEFGDVSVCRTGGDGRVRVTPGRYRCWRPNDRLVPFGNA
jgi:hypothetical protein